MTERETGTDVGPRSTGRVARPGIPIGRLFGIPIYVSPTWFVIAGVITVMFEPSAHQVVDRPESYVVAFTYAVLLYVSVFGHELGHALVARAFGIPVRSVVLHLIGGISDIERDPPTPGRDFLLAFAGPAFSLVLAGAGFAAMELSLPPVAHLLVTTLAVANLIVAVFNLLPGLPLDGGRIVRAGIWKLTGRVATATLAAGWVGRGVAVLVLGLCAFAATHTPDGASTTASWLYLLIGAYVAAFIWFGAGQSMRAARAAERIPLLNARRLARRAVRVPADTPLAEAVRRANEADASAVVVVDHEDAPTGIVSETAVWRVPAARRPWLQVAEVTRSLTPDLIIPADLSGEELMVRVHSMPAGEYLLVEPDGSLYGVLASADVKAAVDRR